MVAVARTGKAGHHAVMMVYAVRGAAGVEEDSADEVCRVVHTLVSEMCRQNGVAEADIVSIVFSQTRDITSANPARCLRQIGFAEAPLFCTQEPEYPESLPRIVRVLLTFRGPEDRHAIPVYQGRAADLRPDMV
ncbi:MAG: chorismate mutase [Spirochaetaceae bacterium]